MNEKLISGAKVAFVLLSSGKLCATREAQLRSFEKTRTLRL